MKPRRGEIIRISANGDAPIPARLRRQVGLRGGSYVEVVAEGNALKLIPVGAIPRNQLGFHTPDWIKAEREASHAHKKGKAIRYRNVQQMLEDLGK